MISPAEFIPVAEESGLIIPLTEWVIQEACEQNKAWQQAGFPFTDGGQHLWSAFQSAKDR